MQENAKKHMQLLTLKETAGKIGVSINTMRKWKNCPRVYISPSRCRYSLDAVLAWLKENQNKGVEA